MKVMLKKDNNILTFDWEENTDMTVVMYTTSNKKIEFAKQSAVNESFFEDDERVLHSIVSKTKGTRNEDECEMLTLDKKSNEITVKKFYDYAPPESHIKNFTRNGWDFLSTSGGMLSLKSA